MMPADSTGSIGPNTVLTTPVRTNPAWSNASNCSLPACACGWSTARDTGFICYLVRTGFAMDGNSLHTFGNGSHGQISAAGLIHGKGGVLCGTTAAGEGLRPVMEGVARSSGSSHRQGSRQATGRK